MFHHRIVEKLKKFVSTESTERALESWLLSNYQAILDSGEDCAIALANELNALFVEQGEDLLSSEELEFALMQILQREESSVSISVGPMFVHTKAVNTVRKRLQIAGQITDVHLTLTAG